MDQKPDVPEPEADHRRGGPFTLFLWVFFLVFVVYPLSIGPAAWLHLKAPSTRPALEVIYAPLTALSDHSDPVRDVMLWYVTKIWRIPFPQ